MKWLVIFLFFERNIAFRLNGGIRSLIHLHVFTNTVFKEITEEYIEKPSIIHFVSSSDWNLNHLSVNIFYISCLVFSIWIHLSYRSSDSSLHRLERIPDIKHLKRKFSYLVLVFMIIFTKNIENAI
jgi:hypothetical protein